MTTDLDWRELIDHSFGDGPGHRPVADRLVAGRRALRRRRIAVGAAAMALVVAGGGAAWAAQPSDTGSGAPVAGNRDDPDHRVDAGSDDAFPGELVWWTESGWQVARGWTIVERVPNPMEYAPPKQSVAFELKNPPEHRLAMAAYDGDCCTSVHSTPAAAGALEDWLPGAIANQRELDGDPAPAPVSFGAGEKLVAAEGVTILEQVPHPALPANFAPQSARTAAAWVDDHGQERFVVVREIDGKADVIPFTGDFASLDKFLKFAERQYASEEGLR